MNKADDLPAKRQYMNLLFDFYGSLLTKKQAECFTLRYVDDYSLAEIAQELGISPQAVVDFLKRGITSLEQYETHLNLVRKHHKRQALSDCIIVNLNHVKQSMLQASVADIYNSFENIKNLVADINQVEY